MRSLPPLAVAALALTAPTSASAAWAPATTLTPTPPAAEDIQVGIDARGRSLTAWAPFFEQPPFVGFASCTSNGCRTLGQTDEPAFSRQLGVDASGKAYFMTVRRSGRRFVVRLATGSTAAGLGAVLRIDGRHTAAEAAYLSVSPSGSAYAAWQRDERGDRGIYLARLDRPGRPQRVAPAGQLLGLAAGPRGEAAIAYTRDADVDRFLLVRRRSAGGVLEPRRRLNADDPYEPENDELTVDVAIGPNGGVVVGWVRDFLGSGGPDGTDGAFIEGHVAVPGSRSSRLRAAGEVAVAFAGARPIVAWEQGTTVRAATVRPGGIGPGQILDRRAGRFLDLDGSPRGDALLAWQFDYDDDANARSLASAYLRPTRSTFGRSERIRDAVAGPDRAVGSIAIGLRPDGSGEAFAAWPEGPVVDFERTVEAVRVSRYVSR